MIWHPDIAKLSLNSTQFQFQFKQRLALSPPWYLPTQHPDHIYRLRYAITTNQGSTQATSTKLPFAQQNVQLLLPPHWSPRFAPSTPFNPVDPCPSPLPSWPVFNHYEQGTIFKSRHPFVNLKGTFSLLKAIPRLNFSLLLLLHKAPTPSYYILHKTTTPSLLNLPSLLSAPFLTQQCQPVPCTALSMSQPVGLPTPAYTCLHQPACLPAGHLQNLNPPHLPSPTALASRHHQVLPSCPAMYRPACPCPHLPAYTLKRPFFIISMLKKPLFKGLNFAT